MSEGETLAEELAKFKQDSDYIAWTQIPLGSVSMANSRLPRADVLIMRKSFVDPCLTIYEVKVSRSDFLRDINSGKYRTYFPYCSQFFFATPAGLVNRGDIPEGCGLIVKGDKGWHVLSSAPRREVQLNQELLLKLLIEGFCQRQKGWAQYERLKMAEYPDLKRRALLWGKSIAREFQGAEALVREAHELKKKISNTLGREFHDLDAAVWGIRGEVENFIERRKYLRETVELSTLVMQLWQGTPFFADGVPRKLRQIAERLEGSKRKEGE